VGEPAIVNQEIAIVGGGCAGLSAAVRLVQAGRSVVVLEAAPRAGGRASTFTDSETGERVDNGQHVLFGCYRETYAFLRAIGAEAGAPLDRRLALAMSGPDGRRHVLSCPPLPPPWHLIAGILKWRALPLRDRLSARRLAPLLRAARRDGAAAAARDVDGRLTVDDWLTAHGQSAALCRWLWHPLAVAALNQSPGAAAAAPFVRVLAELFGPGVQDSAIAMPVVPLEELYALPASRFVESRGGRVLTTSPARLRVVDGHLTVSTRGDVLRPRHVISAVPWHAFGQLWGGELPEALTAIGSAAVAMAAVPIVTAVLWFDRPILRERFLGFVDDRTHAFHWAFNRGGHISMVSSGAESFGRLDRDEILHIARTQLEAAVPAARGAGLLRARVVREHRATFSVAPGMPPRPDTRTPLRGFYLAGDWTSTGLPGTIESAVMSGHRAADAVIADAG